MNAEESTISEVSKVLKEKLAPDFLFLLVAFDKAGAGSEMNTVSNLPKEDIPGFVRDIADAMKGGTFRDVDTL